MGGDPNLADGLAQKWPLLLQPPGKTVILPEVKVEDHCCTPHKSFMKALAGKKTLKRQITLIMTL